MRDTPETATSGAAGARNAQWSDGELFALMRAHAPAGIDPSAMLPVLRELVANGTDPRDLVAAMQSAGTVVHHTGSTTAGTDQARAAADAASAQGLSPLASANNVERTRGRTPVARGRSWYLRKTAIVLFWLGLWELTDQIVDNRLLLAGPIRTLEALIAAAAEPAFWGIAGSSLGRIVLGFCAALAAGILLAVVGHRLQWFRELLAPLMSVIKTVPVVSFIIMLLIWLGGQALTSWLAFLIVLPLVYTSMLTGLGAVSVLDLERARVFRLSKWKRFWYLSRPAFMPFLTNACKVGVGMSWRAGIMAELFATTTGSIGKELFTAKTFLDTPTLFAWTVVVMVLSVLCERLVMLVLRWCSRPCGGWLGKEQ